MQVGAVLVPPSEQASQNAPPPGSDQGFAELFEAEDIREDPLAEPDEAALNPAAEVQLALLALALIAPKSPDPLPSGLQIQTADPAYTLAQSPGAATHSMALPDSPPQAPAPEAIQPTEKEAIPRANPPQTAAPDVPAAPLPALPRHPEPNVALPATTRADLPPIPNPLPGDLTEAVAAQPQTLARPRLPGAADDLPSDDALPLPSPLRSTESAARLRLEAFADAGPSLPPATASVTKPQTAVPPSAAAQTPEPFASPAPPQAAAANSQAPGSQAAEPNSTELAAPEPLPAATQPDSRDPAAAPVSQPQTDRPPLPGGENAAFALNPHAPAFDSADLPRAGLPPGMPNATLADLPAVLHQNAAKAATSAVELLLNPEELGRMRFEMQHTDDHLRVVLTVERPETQDLLRRHADQLLAELKSAGYAGASLSFGQWGQGHSSAKPQPMPEIQAEPQPEILAAPPPTLRITAAQTAHSQGQGLNLRL